MSLDDGALQIVVEQHARDAAEVGKRLDVPAHEERHRRAGKEAEEQPARVAEHHHERPERPLRAADLQLAEVRPVDLSLLTRHRAEPLERLRGLLRTEPTDDAPKVIGPARIAALLDHDVEATRAKPRILLELLDDERHERVDHRRPRRDDLRVDAGVPQHALHGRVVQAELAGDGADRPLLAVIEAHDLRLRLLGDHRLASSSRWSARNTRRAAAQVAPRGAASSPSPERQRRSAERAATDIANRNVIVVLSAGGDLRRER